MSKLKTVRDSLPIIHSKNIIDDEELLLLFMLNCSTYLDLSYWSYESFDPDPWSEDESKSKLRSLTANMKSLVNILWLHDVLTYDNSHMEWFLILLKFMHIPQTLCLPLLTKALLDHYSSYLWSQMLCWTFYLIIGFIFLEQFDKTGCRNNS